MCNQAAPVRRSLATTKRCATVSGGEGIPSGGGERGSPSAKKLRTATAAFTHCSTATRARDQGFRGAGRFQGANGLGKGNTEAEAPRGGTGPPGVDGFRWDLNWCATKRPKAQGSAARRRGKATIPQACVWFSARTGAAAAMPNSATAARGKPLFGCPAARPLCEPGGDAGRGAPPGGRGGSRLSGLAGPAGRGCCALEGGRAPGRAAPRGGPGPSPGGPPPGPLRSGRNP